MPHTNVLGVESYAVVITMMLESGNSVLIAEEERKAEFDMERYIDAELTKQALTGWETDPTDEEINYTIDNIPTADVAPRAEWISVEERLPEESCECLAADGNGVIYLLQYSYRYKAFNATDDDDGDRWKVGGLTHWMPLPEPPKTEDKS